MNFDTYCFSDRGARPNNEDYAGFCYLKHRYGIWAVADGLGGHEAGEVASRSAVESALEEFARAPGTDQSAALRVVQFAQDAVCSLQGDDHRYGSMKTTFVAMLYRRGRAMFAHVGDSRLYLFRKNRIIHQTRDHTLSQLEAAAGRIPDGDVRFHRDRNKLIRAIGGSGYQPELLPEPVRIRRGDAVLLCTDGFWENVLEQCMEDTLSISSSPEQWVKLMCFHHAKVQTDRQDNYTAMAVFVR